MMPRPLPIRGLPLAPPVQGLTVMEDVIHATSSHPRRQIAPIPLTQSAIALAAPPTAKTAVTPRAATATATQPNKATATATASPTATALTTTAPTTATAAAIAQAPAATKPAKHPRWQPHGEYQPTQNRPRQRPQQTATPAATTTAPATATAIAPPAAATATTTAAPATTAVKTSAPTATASAFANSKANAAAYKPTIAAAAGIAHATTTTTAHANATARAHAPALTASATAPSSAAATATAIAGDLFPARRYRKAIPELVPIRPEALSTHHHPLTIRTPRDVVRFFPIVTSVSLALAGLSGLLAGGIANRALGGATPPIYFMACYLALFLLNFLTHCFAARGQLFFHNKRRFLRLLTANALLFLPHFIAYSILAGLAAK
jgi:hypothetical protein